MIRTPTEAKGGITAEEKSALDKYTKFWIANAMRTDRVDQEKVKAAITSLYVAADLEAPRVIVVPSPRVMVFAGVLAACTLEFRARGLVAGAATDAATNAATNAATDAATDAATYAATYAATDAATNAATDVVTYAATNAATHAAIHLPNKHWYVQLCEEFTNPTLAGRIIKELPNWYKVYQGGNMWSSYPGYLSAMRDVLKLTGLTCWDKYATWEACAIEGGFRYMHKDFCMVSDRPITLKVDAEDRPHCEDGPSHLWSDGWALYYWHGVSIPEEWVTDKASLTAQMALTWENVEQRRVACEIVGWARIIKELDARVIDVDSDPEIGTLLEVDLPDSGKEKFIQVVCGTGRIFCLPVPREMKTALQANAWSYGLDGETYRPEVRT